MKFFKNVIGAVLAARLVAGKPIYQRAAAFNYGVTPVRGVNIGGWLVLEPWITPSIFQSVDQSLGIVDEFTLTAQLGPEKALEILQPHWDSWCTLDDFQKIANAGFNLVRIPIGYWAYALYDGETYTQGAAPYMDAAIDWARQTGLKVWIDLHGAPGSQNAFDNSGHRKATPGWQQGGTVAQTLEVLNTITKKYAQTSYQDVVVGIELLNEPANWALNFDTLEQFYRDGYGQVRAVSDSPVIIHDAFYQPDTWNNILNPGDNGATNVVVDHHEYQVFSNSLVAMSGAQHIDFVCSNSHTYAGSDKFVIVGEFTAAMTDCAFALNGYGVGARYDGTYPGSTNVASCAGINNINTWNATYKADVKNYLYAQLASFETKAQGWIFWNFKTEGAHEWDALVLADNGMWPDLRGERFVAMC
ncbi:glycoside hydrolase family 5 protein [Rutstroemia sp. NJR-2017a WRK4]|nr:glycoside hydrolase family 5 protein [Rutstroemia sp. NJR-2017a WRK4]